MKSILFLSMLLITFSFFSCEKDTRTPINPGPNGTQLLGWTGTDKISDVPVTTNFGFSNGNLPSKHDLVNFLPPMASQGAYGTCVAWAAGYNMQTALNAINNNLKQSDLSASTYQSSPKDLFWAIPINEKGKDCNGTNIEKALDVMQNRGVATMSTVPYDNLGDCSSQPQSTWTSEAANNKLKYWRRVDPSVKAVKENIANNIPILIGAYLSDNFVNWRSDDVLTSNTTYNQVGIHAGHAILVTGYDDSKGPNGAFRITNSWGATWGDKGFIWIDYNFFFAEFVPDFGGYKPIYMAATNPGTQPPKPNDNPTSDVDFASWVFEDYSTYPSTNDPTSRRIDFNIYNIGSKVAKASDNWSLYYIYFNAYDANDYGIVFYDEFNTSIPQNTYDCPNDNHCTFNLDIPGNSDFASQAFGTEYLFRSYNMPDITGDYYLLMIADGGDKFQEKDEQNNLFYTTVDPKRFDNGYGVKGGANTDFQFKNKTAISKKNSPFSNINSVNKNAYSQSEIKEFFDKEIRSEKFLTKVSKYNKNSRGKANYNGVVDQN